MGEKHPSNMSHSMSTRGCSATSTFVFSHFCLLTNPVELESTVYMCMYILHSTRVSDILCISFLINPF